MADIWSPLTTHFAVNYVDSEPRTAPVRGIGHHHTASNNELVSLQQFYPGGRTVTPNYFIAGKRIYGIVPENRRAYTTGDKTADNGSITYEILNSTTSPNWAFDPDTLDTVARLDADIMRRYGVKPVHALEGFWEHRNIYEWFRRSYPTACAGPSFLIYNVISSAVFYFNGAPATVIPTPTGGNMFLIYDAAAGRAVNDRQYVLVTVDGGHIRARYLEDPYERAVIVGQVPNLPVTACDAKTFEGFLKKVGYQYKAEIPLVPVKAELKA